MLEGQGRVETPLGPWLRLAVWAERKLAAIERGWRRWRKRRRGEGEVLLVRLDWRLGDEVMALPVYRALQRADPTLRLAVRVRHPQLVEGNPAVERINPLALVPDRILDLRGEVAGEARRVTLAARAGVDLDEVVPKVHLSQRERIDPPVTELDAAGGPRVALHAGATQPCKRWDDASWRRLAGALAADGVVVIQIGEGEVGEAGVELDAAIDLRGRTDVRQLARVLAQVDLVVGEDSGPLHLALAVGTPAVGLFGATDPALLYPVVGSFLPLVTSASCRACWPARTLAYPSGVCPLARHECMQAIDPDEVLAQVRARLSSTTSER